MKNRRIPKTIVKVRNYCKLKVILFILYWHKLKTLMYITKLIIFSHNCVVKRNYITSKNNFPIIISHQFFFMFTNTYKYMDLSTNTRKGTDNTERPSIHGRRFMTRIAVHGIYVLNIYIYIYMYMGYTYKPTIWYSRSCTL